ncbi:hypothetical protein DPM33_04545 [Mesorhizobium hawassense]|uniref:6-phosphogluconate dehydrogenase NADP-binding domain-containing protein n=1 Tax=Mesorhizobium hawassense TaxID=1209954 RepID=A0A330I423_9HYPH|nr:hypothetical protein DPM33_04545 [Mesorhizobium hawassense]
MQVGLIGLGRMGGNIARRLIARGRHDVVVYGRNGNAPAQGTVGLRENWLEPTSSVSTSTAWERMTHPSSHAEMSADKVRDLVLGFRRDSGELGKDDQDQ